MPDWSRNAQAQFAPFVAIRDKTKSQQKWRAVVVNIFLSISLVVSNLTTRDFLVRNFPMSVWFTFTHLFTLSLPCVRHDNLVNHSILATFTQPIKVQLFYRVRSLAKAVFCMLLTLARQPRTRRTTRVRPLSPKNNLTQPTARRTKQTHAQNKHKHTAVHSGAPHARTNAFSHAAHTRPTHKLCCCRRDSAATTHETACAIWADRVEPAQPSTLLVILSLAGASTLCGAIVGIVLYSMFCGLWALPPFQRAAAVFFRPAGVVSCAHAFGVNR